MNAKYMEFKANFVSFRCRPGQRCATFVVGLQVVLSKSEFPYAYLFFPKSGVNWYLFLWQTSLLWCFHWNNSVKLFCFEDYFLWVGAKYSYPDVWPSWCVTVVTDISWLSIKTVKKLDMKLSSSLPLFDWGEADNWPGEEILTIPSILNNLWHVEMS